MNILQSRFRKSLFGAIILVATAAAPAQPSLDRPNVSQKAVVTQTVGVTDITVTYHRPGVKGRAIWGGLVPYGQVWRTGANEVTTISFGDDVTVGGQPLQAGTYGLFTLPRANSWTVILSSNTTTWGTVYDSTKDVLKIDVAPVASEPTEWMMFSFSGLSDTGATLELRWEKLAIPVRLGVDTRRIVLDRGRKVFNDAGPDTGRWQMLRQAAVYAHQHNVALDEALSWIDRSIAVNSNFQSLCVKADILALSGKSSATVPILRAAITNAKESELTSYALSLRRANRPDRAIYLLDQYVKEHRPSPAILRSLGESYDAAGNRDKALASYSQALGMADEGTAKAEIQQLIDELTGRK